MRDPALRSTSGTEGTTPVLLLSGDLNAGTAPILRAAFSEFLEDGVDLVGIDLGGVTTVNKDGRDALLACRAHASAAGTSLVLLHPTRRVRWLAGLDDMMFPLEGWD